MLASVIETKREDGYTRRRYECSSGHRFSTKESISQGVAINKEEKVKRLEAALRNAARIQPHQLWPKSFGSSV